MTLNLQAIGSIELEEQSILQRNRCGAAALNGRKKIDRRKIMIEKKVIRLSRWDQ
jgi:hypothetical protein